MKQIPWRWAIAKAWKQLRAGIWLRLRRLPLLGQRLTRAWHARRYWQQMNVPLRLDPPVGFNDLIVHRLLYDRDPRLRIVCDKIAVRDLIHKRVGASYLIPLLGTWSDPRTIDWEALPDCFVLKPTHSSGPIAMVRDRSDRAPEELTALAQEWLRHDYFDSSLEWGYRDLPRRLMAEVLLRGPDGHAPVEAHVLTFGGQVALIRILTGTKSTPSRCNDWFDREGNRLDNFSGDVAQSGVSVSLQDIEALVAASERAAAGFEHMRVDFYLTDSGLKIGELTPYHGAGLTVWRSPLHDDALGNAWRDPNRINLISKIGTIATDTRLPNGKSPPSPAGAFEDQCSVRAGGSGAIQSLPPRLSAGPSSASISTSPRTACGSAN